jgi:hypothetical protein
MKKMMFLSLALSVMAIGGAVANDSYAAEMGGPKKIKVNINVAPDCNCNPPIKFVVAPGRPNRDYCKHCDAFSHSRNYHKPPKCGHKPARPGGPRFEHGKPNGHKPHGGAPGDRPNTPPPAPKPGRR